MWHFSMQGLPANNVTINCREPLPHVFTLSTRQLSSLLGGTWRWVEVIFCGTICPRQVGARSLTGALPCAVRTFLPDALGRSDSLACSKEILYKERTAKIITDYRINRINSLKF